MLLHQYGELINGGTFASRRVAIECEPSCDESESVGTHLWWECASGNPLAMRTLECELSCDGNVRVETFS